MLRDAINGMSSVLDSDIFPGTIILITGPPGSLKSGFTFDALSSYLSAHPDKRGLYMTLEETTESHLRNMSSLGIEVPDNLIISDYSDIRTRFESDEVEHPDFMDLISNVITFFKNHEGEEFDVFGFDSLGALYSLTATENLRSRVFHFFKMLRENQLTSFVVMESPNGSSLPVGAGSEGFLCDGIIRLGTINANQDILLYLQVVKMRATAHSRKKFLLEVTESGVAVLSPVLE